MPARFGFAYVPEQSHEPLTVGAVLRDSFGVFTFGAFMAGVVVIVAMLCAGTG